MAVFPEPQSLYYKLDQFEDFENDLLVSLEYLCSSTKTYEAYVSLKENATPGYPVHKFTQSLTEVSREKVLEFNVRKSWNEAEKDRLQRKAIDAYVSFVNAHNLFLKLSAYVPRDQEMVHNISKLNQVEINFASRLGIESN